MRVMSRRYRRRKNNVLNYFLTIIILFLIGVLCYKIYTEQIKPDNKVKSNNKTEENIDKQDNKDNKKENNKELKNTNTNNTTNNEAKPTEKVTDKSSKNEKTENKNEQARKGGTVTLELKGEDTVTVSKGSNYKDEGFTATYSDGSDASSEVDVDNAVDTSKKGVYTVTYSVGNTVVIRRVTVE